ncbi:hypothetical protein Vadar_030788 [Vaccinium darrowii]|uniref:Uncharacterized protein n=1 Tax=Vaccinium darrowii TaxID=229202 RepID=A0ACB7XL54_9ERIC|nr:hypothetical protein Vadar_030788 [Vaccinium darrowii]
MQAFVLLVRFLPYCHSNSLEGQSSAVGTVPEGQSDDCIACCSDCGLVIMAFNVEDQSEDSLKCFPTLPRLQYAASEYQPCWFVSVIRRIHQYMKVVIPAEFAMVPPRATCTEEHVQTRHDVKYWMRKPHPLNTKQDWQERLKNIGKKRADDFEKPGNSTMSFAIFDENLYLMDSNRFESELEGLDCTSESIASQTTPATLSTRFGEKSKQKDGDSRRMRYSPTLKTLYAQNLEKGGREEEHPKKFWIYRNGLNGCSLLTDKTGTLTLNKFTVDKNLIEDAIYASIVGMLSDPTGARA